MAQKTILITGCSSGIGYDAAHGLRARGWRVFASCRKPEDCARLQAEGFDSPHLDYTDESSMDGCLSQVLEATGGTLDALFNNGAMAVPGATEDVPTAAFRLTLETNLVGYHHLTRAVIPIMRAQGHGRIVNCSSVLGLVVGPWRGAYTASKFALEAMTDTLRLEMRGTDIRVCLLEPGPITTDIRKNYTAQFEKWIDWESSALADLYRTSLLKRLYRDSVPGRFELPPSAVTAKLVHALESQRPKARYFVTTPTYLMDIARRVLPVRALDWILAKG